MSTCDAPSTSNHCFTGTPRLITLFFGAGGLALIVLTGLVSGEWVWTTRAHVQMVTSRLMCTPTVVQSPPPLSSATQVSAKSDLQLVEKEVQPEKRYEGFRAFLQKYPQAEQAQYVREQLNATRVMLIFEYREAGKLEDAFRVGTEFLKEQATFKKNEDELLVCITLGEEAGRLSLKGNFQYLGAGELFARQAIALIDAGQKIQAVTTEWDASKNRFLSQMYQTIGVSNFKDHKFDDAVLSLSRSIEFNCRDPFSYYLASLVYQEQYFEAATQFNSFSDKQSSDARLALAKARASAAKAAEFMAKTIVVCESCMTAGDKESATYGKLLTSCRTDIEDPFRVSHNNKLDGLDEYIQSMRARICSK